MGRQKTTPPCFNLLKLFEQPWCVTLRLQELRLRHQRELNPIELTLTALSLCPKGQSVMSYSGNMTGTLQWLQNVCAWITRSAWWAIPRPLFPILLNWCARTHTCTYTLLGQGCVVRIECWSIDLTWSTSQERFYEEELKDNAYWAAPQLVSWWRCLTKRHWAPSLSTSLRVIRSIIDSVDRHSDASYHWNVPAEVQHN